MPNFTALSESDGGPAPSLHTLWDMFQATVRTNSQSPAVVSVHQPPDHLSNLLGSTDASSHDTSLTCSYEQLDHASDKIAMALRDRHGPNTNLSIATFLWNSIEWAIWFWVAARMGVTFVPIDLHVLEREEEAAYILDLVRPDVIVAHDPTLAAAVDTLPVLNDSANPLKVVANASQDFARVGWHEMVAFSNTAGLRASDESIEKSPAPNDTALVLFTGGTTGRPKGCPHTVSSLSAAASNYQLSRRIDGETKFLIQSANFRILCQVSSIASWRVGGRIVFPAAEYGVGDVVQTVNAYDCTHMLCVPSRVYEFARYPSIDAQRPSTLKVLGLTGDILRTEFAAFAAKTLRAAFTLNSWGMTEGTGLIGWLPSDKTKARGDIEAVGRALPGTRVRICHPENRSVLPRDEIGELHVGGSSSPIIPYYLDNRNPEAFYQDNVTADRWFRTGDRALMDNDGLIFVLGRFKDVIKRGGVNVIPHILEVFLNRQPGIAESQVVGIPDKVYRAVPVAILKLEQQGKAQLRIEDLQNSVAVKVGKEYTPAHIFTLEELGLHDFPISWDASARKVLKRELVRIVCEKLGIA